MGGGDVDKSACWLKVLHAWHKAASGSPPYSTCVTFDAADVQNIFPGEKKTYLATLAFPP